jgi:D-alanyl-lipoteichoic acid acyltransferase DltB (MBOAT superfamily)
MLLAASYFFYGWWDWRFLSLIALSTICDYYCGLKISNLQEKKLRQKYLYLSIILNLSLLGFFKYWNFFTDSFAELLLKIGLQAHMPTLKIILPVGISFYTFQTMTYTIDIYRNDFKPTRHFFNFALFVAFFPQLVAGPIERASRLLPQIEKKRHFKIDQFKRGLQLIFWGMFKKVFVADNLGLIVDQVYNAPTASGMAYIVGTWAFAFQIFCDFSGYSDIARGTSKCMGIEILHNFKNPYFAANPSDLWRRWHISLSTWLRDYLYIPLGGNRGGSMATYRNLMITMTLGGLWHGAAWNFVIWGIYHGMLLSIHRFIADLVKIRERFNPSMSVYIIKAFIMFQLTCIGWIFFRATSFDQIVMVFGKLPKFYIYDPEAMGLFLRSMFFMLIPLCVMVYKIFEEMVPQPFKSTRVLGTLSLSNQPLMIKGMSYGIMTYLLCLYGASSKAFIYFQF